MAKKAFEIQGANLKIGGIDLQAGTTGVVIPGVTQAANYRVEEVEDYGDQTLTFGEPPVVIDSVTFDDYVADGTSTGRAEYIVEELDDDGYIDGIEVSDTGTYTAQESNTNAGSDLLAYTGVEADPFASFVSEDWSEIPFRPKMRAGEIENVSGGSGSVVARNINFPQGEEGDTQGTIALTETGDTYICTADWSEANANVGNNNIETNQEYLIGQSGGSFMIWTVTLADYPDIQAIFEVAGYTSGTGWEYPNPEYFSVTSSDNADPEAPRQCTSVGIDNGGDLYFRILRIEGDAVGLPTGSTATVSWEIPPQQPAIWNQINFNSGSLTNVGYFDEGSGYESTLSFAYNFDIDVESAHLNIRGDGIWDIGSSNFDTEIYSIDYADTGGDPIDIVVRANANEWVFTRDGELKFPDGSIQNTAYSSGELGPLYVVANVDGNIIYSTDGTTFSAAFDTGLGQIGTVAIGPNLVVYSGLDLNGDADTPGLFSSTNPTTQPTLIPGTDGSGNYYLAQVQYFPSAPVPWVAVGIETAGSPWAPIILHSTDGITWNETRINAEDLAIFFTDDAVELRFTDIEYASGGWFIAADRNNGTGAKGGGLWWTTDITQELTTGSNFIPVDANFKAVEVFASSFFSRWQAFAADGSQDGEWWFNSDNTPTTTESWSPFNGGEGTPIIPQVIQDGTNLENQTLEEATSGLATTGNYIWATSSSDGHIVWWANEPAGPYLSIPAPFTVTLDNFAQSATSYIDVESGGGFGYLQPGEKFTITGSSVEGYNGTFYINGSYFVYTDAELTTPFDTSGLDPFTGTATLTWSHGQYIDALGFANGYIYCANDDEQVFRGEFSDSGGGSIDTLTWTKVDDKNNSLEYWNDLSYYGSFNSGVTVNRLTNGAYQVSLSNTGVTRLPGAVISTPVAPAAGEYGTSDTALDLTKQIQVLTSDGTNNGYSLADGTEGQIMYFVPAAGVTGSLYVKIANARILDIGNTFMPIEQANYSWLPFDNDTQPKTIAMAIFADGAWCLRGGATD